MCIRDSVEERELDLPRLDQRPDGRGPQRRDPIQALDRFDSSRIRASVIMPRSPTSTTRESLKRWRSFLIWDPSVLGSAVFPSNTSTATGHPARLHKSQKTIWFLRRNLPYTALRPPSLCRKVHAHLDSTSISLDGRFA